MTEEKHRFLNTTMRLKLTAVRLSADGDMSLDEEEREMMPHLYRSQDTELGEERQLDQWWEIEVDEELQEGDIVAETEQNVYAIKIYVPKKRQEVEPPRMNKSYL